MRSTTLGDYVLATKWADGDPKDQWCIGFYAGDIRPGHFDVRDNEGRSFRANGFRRVEAISRKRGEFILKNRDVIANSCRSLWWWKRCKILD